MNKLRLYSNTYKYIPPMKKMLWTFSWLASLTGKLSLQTHTHAHTYTWIMYSGAPEIVSASPSYLKVSAGSSVLLTCLADTRDFPTYEWFKDGKRIPDNGTSRRY